MKSRKLLQAKIFFSDKTLKFDAVCIFCRDGEVDMAGDVVKGLQKEYAIVRPICNSCLESGKRPVTRNALAQKKKEINGMRMKELVVGLFICPRTFADLKRPIFFFTSQ